jgi:hypothetical protein
MYMRKTASKAYAIDVRDFRGFYEGTGVTFIAGDFLTEPSFQENSIDVITDACAIGCSMDIPVALRRIQALLKPGGHFITVGDVALHNTVGNFISPSAWIDLATQAGLRLVGDYVEDTTDIFVKMVLPPYGDLNIVRLVFQKPMQ